jgi:purine-binding chemotaxis protein CheW
MFRDGTERLLVFRTGAELFAVRLGDVHEVIDTPALQPVPDAGSRLLGVAMVRGELIPVHDPAPVLQVEAAHAAAGVVLLFVRGGKRIGLAVDDVFDAISVEAHELRPAPGSEAADGVLAGVVRRGSELIGVLDAGALLEAATAVMEGGRT